MNQSDFIRSWHARSGVRGFTLIELMTVIGILGILAAIAIAAYTKNIHAARRTEVIGDISNIGLRQETALSVRGHYVTTTTDETDTYPVAQGDLANHNTEIRWNIQNNGYTRDAVGDTAYYRGGGDEHGWDALNFIPEQGSSWCAYGTMSGTGPSITPSDDTDDDIPPAGQPLANEVFQPGNAATEQFYQFNWYYVWAKCNFDRDNVFWEFTKPHFRSEISTGDDGNFGE